MIIDMKYHIASLVAVFLALGIGIFIGTSMVGSDALVNMQKQVTDRLEKNYEQLQRENKEAQAQMNQLEKDAGFFKEFSEEIFPLLIENRLVGLEVAVIETNNLASHQEIYDVLRLAGVKINSITTYLGGMDFENSSSLDDIKAALGVQGDKPQDYLAAIAGEVTAAITNGENIDRLNYLQSQNLIKISGEYGNPVNGVIFIGGSLTYADMYAQVLDEPMIKFFTQAGIPVYGIETTDVPVSYMKAYQRMKITTVDNVDTVPGQVALVFAMQNQPGHYGVKETAKKLLPELTQ